MFPTFPHLDLTKHLSPYRMYMLLMSEATTTVTVDERGRLYLPKAVREKLDIEGEETVVEVEVRV